MFIQQYSIIVNELLTTSFLASEEGAYSFLFAENKTIHQFLYSRVIFRTRGLHTWASIFKNDPNQTHVKKTSLRNFTIQPNEDFKGCLEYYNYDITMKHNGFTPIHEYITCIIFNGDSGRCNWEWIPEKNSFSVVLNRTTFNSTKFERYEKYGIGQDDMFGIIRCKLLDHDMMRHVIFDLPFVNYGNQTTAVPEETNSDGTTLNPILFSITSTLSIIGLLTLIFNYQRRKQRIAKMKDKIIRYLFYFNANNLGHLFIFDRYN